MQVSGSASGDEAGQSTHILSIPSWYDSDYRPGRCRFFSDHARAVQSAGMTIRLLFPDLRRPTKDALGDLPRRRFQTRYGMEHGVDTLRCMGWTVVPSSVRSGMLKEEEWIIIGERLGISYARRYGVPDIIHAHTLIGAGMVAARLSRRWAVPWMFTEHSTEWMMTPPPPPLRLRYATNAARSATSAIAVSRALLEAMATYNLCSAPITKVVPNAVDTDYFATDGVIARRRDSGFRFAYVGSVDRTRKRTDMLLRAFASVARRHPNAYLDVVGDGAIAALQPYAQQLGVAARVTWHGFLQRDALRMVLWNADAYVHPSRWETFGVSVAEALATGLPVVATACGGIDDILTADLKGLGCSIVPVDDEAGFVDAMIRVIESGQSAQADLRRRRSEIVLGRYALRTVGQTYAQIYGDVVGMGRVRIGPRR